jgi:hypothetical protein
MPRTSTRHHRARRGLAGRAYGASQSGMERRWGMEPHTLLIPTQGRHGWKVPSRDDSPHTIGFGSLSRRASRFSCVLGSESEGSLGTWSWIMKRKLAIIETKSAVNLFLSSISKRVLAHRTTKLTHLSLRLFSPISVALYLASLSNCFRMIRHETSLIGRA